MTVENAGGGGESGGAASSGGAAGGAGQAAGGAGGEAAGTAAGAGAAHQGGDGGAGAASAQAYTPNFKYKVTGVQNGVPGKVEKEIPDWARPFLTSSDVEKNVRELFEKSDGIDAVKQHRDQLVQENQQMRAEWGPTIQNVQTLVGHLQRGDLDSFFEAVNIPEAAILKYALYRLQLKENPQRAQEHNEMRQLQLQNQQLLQQVQQFSGGYQDLAIQQRTMQLDATIARPDLQAVAQAYDARVGAPGAFRAAVIRRGQAYAAAGQDVTVEQAVTEELQLAQQLLAAAAASQGQQGLAPGAGAAGTAAGAPGEKPTFPNVRGKGTSPAKKVIKSTEDLRALARQRA